MAIFRVLLAVFALAIVVLVGVYLLTGQRRYLQWVGRLFLVGTFAAVLFFVILLIQRFV